MVQKAHNIKLPIGISDFRELIKGKYIFADKTLFVKDILEDGAKVILLTRPRRFGKTLNLSTLYYFLEYSQDKDLFERLEISKDASFCRAHQNQYPVMFVTFKDIKKSSYQSAYAHIVGLIRELYSQHRYLLDDTILQDDERKIFMDLLNEEAAQHNLERSIKQLSEYITRKFNKSPVLLLDEYDTPIQEAYLQGYYKEMVELMRGILGAALKDNKYLEKAIVTGITKVSQESLFSGLNNIIVYSLLREKYGQYFGFTENEVSKLIEETKQRIELDVIREWYNGYQIGKHILYNPWSIINCLENNGVLQSYWVNTSSNDLVGKLISKASVDVKHQFEELLQGKIIEQPLSENLVFPYIEIKKEALWSLLLYTGYLKVLSSELGNYQLMAKLAIPNKEVGFVYNEIVLDWFRITTGVGSYVEFVESLSKGNLEKFKDYLSNYLTQTGSYFDFNSNTPEQIFHIFILGLVVGLRDQYYIYSNRESGLGRCDVILIPHDKRRAGLLLEFKTSAKKEQLEAKAQEALNQIKAKRYMEEFKSYNINSVLAIGLAFCKKDVALVHEELFLE